MNSRVRPSIHLRLWGEISLQISDSELFNQVRYDASSDAAPGQIIGEYISERDYE